MKGVFVSDCEGPFSKNDNAYEVASNFMPEGGKLFSIISKYDDVLADVLKRPGYNAGDTLKLILPFLKAYDVTDKQMLDFSENSLLLISGTKETMNHISGLADSFIVSTSYEHYIKALCKYVRFPFERTYCTRLEMDKYSLENSEKARLKTIAREIASMPIVTIPEGAKSLEDFSQIDQTAIRRLDQIFWKEIQTMKCGIIFSDVTTIGGQQKAQAIHDITKKTKTALSEVMYVGDSITDVQAFQLVRGGGGLTVSFNGNSYAVRNAEVSVMSDNNLVTAILADKFLKSGKDPTLRLVGNWGDNFLKSSDIESSLLEHFLSLCSDVLPKVQIVTQENMEMLSKESSEFRKQVRGEAVGRLG